MSTSDDDGGFTGQAQQKNQKKSQLCLKVFCTGSKESKLAAVTPYFQARNVWIPAKEAIDANGIKWVNEYIYELTNFPKTRFNDQVDCTSMGVWKLLCTFAAHISPAEVLEDLGIGKFSGIMTTAYANEDANLSEMERVAFGPSFGGDLARDAFGG